MTNEPPSWIDKVNYIIDFREFPCSVPWTLYVRTALPVAEQMLMSVVDFGMSDVVRSMFRPKPALGGRSWRHSRRGRKGGKAGASLLSPGENIGHKLRGSTFLPTASDSRKLDFLWQVDGIQQAGLFWWMVADVTVDGFYHWASLIQQSASCQGSPDGEVSYAVDEQGLLGLLGWMTPLMGQETPHPPPTGWIASPGGFWYQRAPYNAFWWMDLENNSMIPVEVQLGYWHHNPSTEDPDLQGPRVLVPPFGSAPYHYFESFDPSAGAIFGGRTYGGDITMRNPKCIAWS